jgi:hypothetical protein
MKRIIVVLAAWLMSCLAASGFAQGVQSGTIRGLVKDQQELAVQPGGFRSRSFSRFPAIRSHRQQESGSPGGCLRTPGLASHLFRKIGSKGIDCSYPVTNSHIAVT